MKTTIKTYITTKQLKFFTALILTSILCVGSNFTLLKSATAAPRNILPEKVNEILDINHKSSGLPLPVARAVLQDVSRTQGVLASQLKIAEYHQQTWSNGCLGLPKPDEFCTQALVPGWRVIVSNGTQNWIYHTNSNGRSLRLANSANFANNQSKNLPTSVKNAVLAAASKLTKLPTSRIRIVNFKQITTDGCLGLPRPDEACIAIAQQAWEVNLQAGKQLLVYRTNRNGSQVRRNNNLKPVLIPTSELPPLLESGVVFRQISSGGFVGRTYETVLLDDGLLIRTRMGDANDSERSVRRVSLQKLRHFQQLLEEKGVNEFQNLTYPAPSGAADYISYTLTNSNGTVQYNDISQNRLPENLQAVIAGWNKLLRNVD
ncbi:MAG: hypothetical protein ACR9NN_08710 [Nostochopsis sp.]